MAAHWVAEVFPPKFHFQSVDEMLDNTENNKIRIKKDDDLSEVYRRVYVEGEKAKTTANEEHQREREQHAISTPVGSPSDRDAKEMNQEEKKDRDNQDECIWNQKELKMLRKFLQKAKMQNLKLAAMLESAGTEIDTWKGKYKEAAESDELVKSSLFIFKKKYERLKVNYKALKEDVRRYHANLKVSRQDCHQLRLERTDIVKSLNQTKAKLSNEKIEKEQLQSKLEKKDLDCAETVKGREIILQQQHLLEIATLKKEIDRLKGEFGKEKQDNALNKKALEHLRSHFANLQMDNECELGSKAGGDVLSVIDIDYLPK